MSRSASLSGGAQEQTLFADTHRHGRGPGCGRGTLPLILDDALINTDPERIRRIQRLLSPRRRATADHPVQLS